MTGIIEEIRERWAKVTPGPWSWSYENMILGRDSDGDIIVAEGNIDEIDVHREEDKEAVIAAPSDIAFLLAEVDMLRVENAKLRKLASIAWPPGYHGCQQGEGTCDRCEWQKLDAELMSTESTGPQNVSTNREKIDRSKGEP